MGNPRYGNGSKRRAVRAWLRSRGDPCALCGKPIDYSLPSGHPMSFEVDEIVPVSKGGSPYERSNVQAWLTGYATSAKATGRLLRPV